ncbi:MAG TPA: shikimate kinase [Egicoccus sp.]|nr:shikimate kinase [Egicoccus sp.]HSK22522.1 shikimate kinase [Egicoccus sp.]
MAGDARHVVLLGMMGAGKTTTGRALAHHLGRPLRDCDADLEALGGRTGATIAAEDGVDRLHHLEGEVLLAALASDEPAVVTGAGWVVESARCRAALRERAIVVWLDLPVADLLERMAGSAHRRPMVAAEAETVLDRRAAGFAEAADLHLDASRPTADLVAAIAAAVSDAPET